MFQTLSKRKGIILATLKLQSAMVSALNKDKIMLSGLGLDETLTLP